MIKTPVTSASQNAPTVLAVGALQKALEPASPDPAIASHRWVPWACCDAAAAAAARRCAGNYVESAQKSADVAIGKKSSADARALADGPRRGVAATARLDAREASAIIHDFLAGRFGCSLRHACLLANYSLQVAECLSALLSRWNCSPSPKPLMSRYR